jgi:hypothetical protein
MSDIPSWHIVGDWFDNCSCAVPCHCTFAQAPDNGFCESVLFWHVREGHYGDVKLDNLSFVRVGRWEDDLWARKATGIAGLYIDDYADDRQMETLPAIIGGRAGGSRLGQRMLRGRPAEPRHRAGQYHLWGWKADRGIPNPGAGATALAGGVAISRGTDRYSPSRGGMPG